MKGHKEARGKNTWKLVLELGVDAQGYRMRRVRTFHGTSREADAEIVRLLHELETGTYVDETRITVGEYLQHWLESYAKPSVSERTYERYEQIVRLHLTPTLGRHRLAKLRPLQIQAYYAQALESGRVRRQVSVSRQSRCGRSAEDDCAQRGLSAQTVKHHHRVLHEALKQAVKWNVLAVNPADAVQPPRPQRKEINALDAAASVHLLTELEGSPLHLPALIALGTGMRLGEILGLRWKDVDLAAGKLAVRQNLQQTKNGLIFKGPKTAKGQRSIPLMPSTVQALKQDKRIQLERRLALGASYTDNDLVVCQENGTPWPPNRFSAAWRHAVGRSTGIRFHDLRHSHATMLLCQGTHPKVVSERLGHSTIGITLDTYSHVLPNLQDEAARKLEAQLENARVALRTV